MTIPTRDARIKAWNALMRQSEYLGTLAETWRFGPNQNPVAARATLEVSDALREVADWLREDHKED